MKKIITLLLVLSLTSMLMMAEGQKEAPVKEVAPAAKKEAAPVVNVLETEANAYFAEYPGSRIVPADKVFTAMDAGENFLILDIRKAADYEAGHLKGAINAPWGPAIGKSLSWLPDDKPVYVNCYSGQTAGQAIAVLNVAGIEAHSIKYGWNLGITKTEGFEAYTETEANMSPDESGVKFDSKVKAAVEAYFNAIPESGSNIIVAAKLKELLALPTLL